MRATAIPKQVFEQPASFNYLVDDSIPMTWQTRRRTLRLIWPLVVFSSICALEMILIPLWLEERLSDRWSHCIIAFAAPVVMMWLVFEIDIRIRHRSKRVLTLKKGGVSFRPGDHSFPWKRVLAFRFEPFPDSNQLVRCSLVTIGPKRRPTLHPKFALALDTDQRNALTSVISARKMSGLGDVAIEESAFAKSPAIQKKLSVWGQIFWLIGLLFILHGMPIMGVFYGEHHAHPESEKEKFVITKKRVEQLGRFAVRDFKSAKEMRAWWFQLGSTMTAAGVGCLIVSHFCFKEDNDESKQPEL